MDIAYYIDFIPFILGVAFLVFVWGMFQYFIAGGANEESKEKGKSLMVWATLGFVLVIIFWGVVNLVAQRPLRKLSVPFLYMRYHKLN